MSHPSAEEFYDAMSGRYTEAIQQCVPRYVEMLSTLFTYLPANFSPKRILELGCGSGNLTIKTCAFFPDSEITVVDFSEEMHEICRSRTTGSRLIPLKSDFRELAFSDGSFDLVLSSIAIHHLKDDDKKILFGKIHNWLSRSGVLAFADQFRGATIPIYQIHLRRWREEAQQKGVSDAEWNDWMQHQSQHDHHAPLTSHFHWLENSGFKHTDCVWRYLLWAVVSAQKQK